MPFPKGKRKGVRIISTRIFNGQRTRTFKGPVKKTNLENISEPCQSTSTVLQEFNI